MDNIYFKATNLYLVKPSVLTYNADRYFKLEQRIENYDIAIKEDYRYFSIFNNREYIDFVKPDFNKYYININDEDKMLLIRYLYENNIPWTDELESEIFSLIKYFDYDELSNNLENIKDENDTIKIKKIKK